MTVVRGAVALGVRLVSGARATIDACYSEGRATVLDLPSRSVFYANHSSHLDFLTIWAMLPEDLRSRVQPVAAADYWGSGWKGRAATKLFNLHLVERGGTAQRAPDPGQPSERPAADAHPRGLRGQLVGLGEVLDRGGSLILFPEGTRGSGDRIAPFQPGLARLARAYPEVPIVPTALVNLGRILPKGGRVPVPLIASVKFLAPLSIERDESEPAFLERARTVLAAALPDPEGGQG